jgi:demethyllactenocin mycarosyltransferase
MGTVLGGSSGFEPSFFAPFIDAFADREGYELLISAGPTAERLGGLPSNITVRRSVPQIEVLAHTDVFITHVGANSMHEALYYGVPLVCIPHMGDQPQNAERVVAQGAGVILPLDEVSSARVAADVQHVLDDPSFRANAARLSGSLRAGGGLARALQIIERLVSSSHGATGSGRQSAKVNELT